MATASKVKPTHKAVKNYYAALATYADQSVGHEGALRSAFQNLLAETGRKHGWTLIPELSLDANGHQIRPDGTFRDEFTIERGYWEAKDTDDDLEAEIKKKIKRGYRLTNTIFEDTRQGRLYQDGKLDMIADLREPQQLCDLLNAFFSHTEPAHEDFNKAVDEFKQRVPDLARGLVELIKQAHDGNQRFIEAFAKFYELCRQSLNPNLSTAAVDEMLVQHLLTERLIRTVFDSQDFTRRNVIAAEIEKVIDALVSQSFNRHGYLKRLDRFYVAIEHAARTLSSFSEKQHFLNIVYERFFQGYSVKVADTHGIVYTPQEIVDFMCASVAEVLEKEFGKKLGDPGVNILDPCTGTGNFIVNLIGRIPKRDLPRVYREQLFANEVMLLPYYIAALNIEHAYYEKTQKYEPFEGLCFVDTLDLAESDQTTFGFMAEENVQRVERQRKAPITVIIGNPPYNMNQQNENDNNKNRRYEITDKAVQTTYTKDSRATNKTALSDPYVKFFRWASDRLGSRDGIVCFVSKNSFVDDIAFDGMRKHLRHGFSAIYHIDLHGNVRRNPRLSGTTHNVFGIQVGVGVTVAVKKKQLAKRGLFYQRVPEEWRKEEKLAWLSGQATVGNVGWQPLSPMVDHTWLPAQHREEFASLILLGSKEVKSGAQFEAPVIFKTFSVGVKTNRDEVVYDFNGDVLSRRVKEFIEDFNAEIGRYRRAKKPVNVDDFVDYRKIKWSEGLKANLVRERYAEFDEDCIRASIYRPFTQQRLYFSDLLNERRYLFARIIPTPECERENRIICCTNHSQMPFLVQVTGRIPNEAVGGRSGKCFPFYFYDKDGTNRRENITDWALAHFREHYGDRRISKWDIFYYVYGVLHHPGYREKFADNLKRELPRIPLAPPCDQSCDPDQSPERERRVKGGGPVACARGADGGVAQNRTGSKLPLAPGVEKNGASGTHPTGSDGSGGLSSGFRAFAKAGKQLARLHIEYETLKPWPLKWIETPGEPLSYRVEKMRLSKDKKSIEVNDSLTLAGIPPEVFDYRLGNRSAIEWVIDQYRVKEDKRTGIRSDPNTAAARGGSDYIVRLVGQVVRVSVETVKIVAALPRRYAPEPPPSDS